jgi:hypothetical protein
VYSQDKYFEKWHEEVAETIVDWLRLLATFNYI